MFILINVPVVVVSIVVGSNTRKKWRPHQYEWKAPLPPGGALTRNEPNDGGLWLGALRNSAHWLRSSVVSVFVILVPMDRIMRVRRMWVDSRLRQMGMKAPYLSGRGRRNE